MGDSWEDSAAPPPVKPANLLQRDQNKGTGLNPNASSFAFSPGAASFVPGGASSAPKPPPGFSMPTYPPPPGGSVVSSAAAPPSAEAATNTDTSSSAAATEPVAAFHTSTSATPTPARPGEARGEPTSNASTSGAAGPAESVASKMQELKVSDDATNGLSSAKPPQQQSGRPPPAAPDHSKEEDEDEKEDESARQQRELELQQLNDELAKEDPREHMNVVFIGHVDAGKSTTGGQILYLTGNVDERTIQKYEREAKEKNRESWYMAYIMDTNEEERAKGKTVEVGRAHFTTEKKRYTILDAPGHKNYVPNMIAGAAQADVGVLVIAARKGEFETGFERGGQTREHAQLAKTLGVAKLIVAINKMDDPSVIEEDGSWSKARYDEIVTGLTPFLRSCGYNPKKDVIFLPMSGLLGLNIRKPLEKSVASWYKGGTLFDVLDNTDPLPRDPLGPFRMSVIDKYKDMGTIAMGKSEAGIVRKGDRLYVMPNKQAVSVSAIYRDDVEVNAAKGGENLRLRLTGVEEEEMQAGFVICSRHVPVPCVTYFQAQLQLLDLLEHKSIFTAGYKAILHIHSLVEECEITSLISALDMKTKPPTPKKVKFAKSGGIVVVRIQVEKPICVELFENVPQLGRFTLRDEGRTIAIGKIIKLPKSLKEGAPEAK